MMINTMMLITKVPSLLLSSYDVYSDYDDQYFDADYEGSISSDYSGISPSLVAFFSLACRLSTHLLLCWGYR